MNNVLRLATPMLAAVAVGAAVFAGCSSSDSGGTADPTTVDSGSAPRDSEVPMTDSGSNPTDSGTTPTDSGTTPDGGGDTGPWDISSGTCFPGKPTKMVEYLNKCTTSDSVKFTKKLTKLNADGSRPALP